MKIDTIEKHFKDYREALLKECQWLNSAISLYKRINERTQDRLKEINIAPHFFQVVIHSLFSSIVISTFKLFDKNGERGFYNYLGFIEQNLDMFSITELKRRRQYPDDYWLLEGRKSISTQDIKVDRAKIGKLRILPSIELRRDKLHAHLDKDYFTDRSRISEDAPIQWDDLNEVQAIMNEILNKYSIAFDGHEYGIEFWNIDDVDHLLNSVRRDRESENKLSDGAVI